MNACIIERQSSNPSTKIVSVTKMKKTDLQKILRNFGFKKLYQKKDILLKKYSTLQYYFKNINHILTIQKYIKKFIRKLHLDLHGPAFTNIQSCTNITDFYTFDELSNMKSKDIISYRDTSGFVYGFRLDSLHKMFTMAQYKNPYTRELLPQLLYDNLYEIFYRMKNKPTKTKNKYTHSQYWKNKHNMRKLCETFHFTKPDS